MEILGYLAAGHSNKIIARHLNLAGVYRQSACSKPVAQAESKQPRSSCGLCGATQSTATGIVLKGRLKPETLL